ncbi:MAG: GlmU family protein [Bacteroidetes bacterium]|nr:GlmU family protein [Bacteroidota bacterium]
MNYIFFDSVTRPDLLPLTFTRPVADIRFGILTNREKWEKLLKAKTSTLTEDYLKEKFPLVKDEINILLNGTYSPTPELVKEVNALKPNQILVKDDFIIAMKLLAEDLVSMSSESENSEDIPTKLNPLKLNHLWDIFAKNGDAIIEDFKLITKGRKSQPISKTNQVIAPENIFIEKGAKVECAILNATNGPIYIGADAEVMEGSIIRGPFALCEHSVVKMGAKIYGPTTIGPHCKVGGEINNSVFLGYSNKAHDGFLGNSVIGEWCNIGADSNNSNLKNNYEEVKLWNYAQKRFVNTGLQFCGLIMGDHSKCGINTMFNTGTVVGVNANIFGAGFQRNFIASFSWGGITKTTTYEIEKAIEVAEKVFERRDMKFDNKEKKVLKSIFKLTHEFRYI